MFPSGTEIIVVCLYCIPGYSYNDVHVYTDSVQVRTQKTGFFFVANRTDSTICNDTEVSKINDSY